MEHPALAVHLAAAGHPHWIVPGGYLVYSRSQFTAVCSTHHDHKNPCRASRTVDPSERTSLKGAGRPLGFLLAWLQAGPLMAAATRNQHHDTSNKAVALVRYPLAVREACREWLSNQPFAEELLSKERPRRLAAGEPAEPVNLV